MELLNYPQLDQQVYRQILPNGLTVLVAPRPGFTRKIAYFVTDYGAIHTDYTLDGVHHRAPDGVAHYLEHKLFDLPGRDVSEEFAAMGAVVNAFTSYDVTAYYFSCTEDFDKCLALLLEFVSTPYFTEEGVQKEQGIIGQEIGMSQDNPDSRIFEMLMEAMYRKHPIQVPILGSRQTIAEITPQVLHDCHRAFYRPGNMLLCVVGDVQPEEVAGIARRILPQEDTAQVTRQEHWQEEMTPKQPLVTAQMEVAMPMFQLGYKCEPMGKGRDAVKQEAVGDLAAEALFGESSQLYLQLYEQGLIDGSFGGGFETVDGMAMLVAGGDSEDPEAVRDAITARAQELCRQGIGEKDFLRLKRSALGRRIKGLDSFDSTCFRLCAYHMSGFDYFHFPEIYREITREDVLAFLSRVVTQQRCAMAVIYPTGG